VVSEALSKGILFFTNIYLARVLGVSNYGTFVFALSVTFYFWLAVELGTNMYGIREIARNKKNIDVIVNSLFTLRLIAGILVFIIYLSVLMLIDIPVTKRAVFVGCGMYLVTFAIYSDWIMKGLEKFRYVTYGNIVSSISFCLAAVMFVTDRERIVVASISWSLSFLLGGAALFYILRRRLNIKVRLSFDMKKWLFHLRESLFFTISSSLLVIYNYLPVVFLAIFYSSYEVGLFSAPFRIINTITGVGLLLPFAFYPLLSEFYLNDIDKFMITHSKLKKIMFMTGIPVGCAGTLFADKIVLILLGEEYSGSISIFKLLIWIVPLLFIRSSYGSVLMAAGHQRRHNYGAIAGVVTIIIFGLLLIPKYGIKGVAVSLILAEIMIAGTMFMISNALFKHKDQDKEIHGGTR